MDTCISGISHSGRPREGGNLFTVLWGVLERAKNIFFNRLYSIKNMSTDKGIEKIYNNNIIENYRNYAN